MAWHDKSPWARRVDERAKAMDAIGEAVAAFKAGHMSFERAKARIEDVLDGEVSRVRRIGEVQDNEVQT